jgi:hypothetical protein
MFASEIVPTVIVVLALAALNVAVSPTPGTLTEGFQFVVVDQRVPLAPVQVSLAA